jgi:hypothetical protein
MRSPAATSPQHLSARARAVLQRVTSGTYTVDPRALADRLLDALYGDAAQPAAPVALPATTPACRARGR